MMKHFHAFRLDPVNLCLWRGDERIPLRPRAFDLLRYLVEHADRLVTHDEILEALWAGTYVNPEVVKKYILEVRKALGDRPGAPAFIETVPRRGYRFVAPVWIALLGRRQRRGDPALSRAVGLSPRWGSRRGAHGISHKEGGDRKSVV